MNLLTHGLAHLELGVSKPFKHTCFRSPISSVFQDDAQMYQNDVQIMFGAPKNEYSRRTFTAKRAKRKKKTCGKVFSVGW